VHSLERIAEYVDAVCQQVRWKKAHFRVSHELANHLVDARDSYVAQGLDETSATEKAIAEAGDAMDIGTQLDRIHRPKPQWEMFAATALLIMLGLLVRIFIFNDEDRVGLLSVRLLYTGIGIAGMFAAYFADFTIIGRFPKATYFGIVTVPIVLLLLSNIESNKLIYAQYIILFYPLAFAAMIYAMRRKGYLGVLLCGSAIALPSLLALYFPSVSGSVHFALAGAALLGIAICVKWFGTNRLYSFLLMLVPVGMLAIAFFVRVGPHPYRLARLAAALNPYSDPMGAGYMGVMARELLGGAVFFGKGNIPAAYIVGVTSPHSFVYTDLLLTSLISNVGWVAFVVVIAALLFFIAKGFARCFRQKSGLGLFVSVAIMIMFCAQAISYVAYNLGFLLVAPISLPLISHGNTATVANLVLIGFMLSVFRTGDAADSLCFGYTS
jgi:cell division protein FtsW (lipid II flippase)